MDGNRDLMKAGNAYITLDKRTLLYMYLFIPVERYITITHKRHQYLLPDPYQQA